MHSDDLDVFYFLNGKCKNVTSVMLKYRRGSMDISTTRLLSIHVAALLPPTSTELDISHNIQVAAVLGIGLLYQSTAHRHMAEVLLSEIGLLSADLPLI